MYESTDKMVSHPGHYQSKNGLETIQVIEAFTEGLEGIEATDTGNIIKYACRWKDKNGIQDLEKILWYTQHLIDHLKAKEDSEVEGYIDGSTYMKEESVAEPLILEKEDFSEKEWKTIQNIFGMEYAMRIVLSNYKFEAFGVHKTGPEYPSYTKNGRMPMKTEEVKQTLNNIYGTNKHLQEQGKKFLADCYAEKEKQNKLAGTRCHSMTIDEYILDENKPKLLSDLTDEEKQETLRNSDVTILHTAEEVKKKCPELFNKVASNGSSSN